MANEQEIATRIRVLEERIAETVQQRSCSTDVEERRLLLQQANLLQEEKLLHLRKLEKLQEFVAADEEVWAQILAPLPPDVMCRKLDLASLERFLFVPLARKVPVLGIPELIRDYPMLYEKSTDGRVAMNVYATFFPYSHNAPPSGCGESLVSGYYNGFVLRLAEVLRSQFNFEVVVMAGDSLEDPSSSVNQRDRIIRIRCGSVPVALMEHRDEKSTAFDLLDTNSRHRCSTACVYGDLEYIFGCVADPRDAHLLVLPLQGSRDCLGVLRRRLRMEDKDDRQQYLVAMVNLFRWVRTIHVSQILCRTELDMLKDHVRPNPWSDCPEAGRTLVNLGLTHVCKQFTVPCSAVGDLKALYALLHHGSLKNAVEADVIIDGVPCFEQVLKKPRRSTASVCEDWLQVELHLRPVGCSVAYDMEEAQVFCMIQSILECLCELHRHGFCHYDIRRENVIQYRGRFLLHDFELAGRIGQPVPFQSRFWMQGCEKLYSAQNDLYMVGKHLIKTCIHRSALLDGLGERLICGSISTAEQALENLSHEHPAEH